MLNPSTSWRTTLQPLRDDFHKAAELYPNLRHVIVQAVDEEGSLPPSLEREMRDAGGWCVGEIRGRWEIPTQNDPATGDDQGLFLDWVRWNSPAKQGYLFGDPAGRHKFEYLAERAWLALPGTPDGKAQAHPQPHTVDRWLDFVYYQLTHPRSSYLAVEDHLWVVDYAEGGQSVERRFPPRAVKQGSIVSTGYPDAEGLSDRARRWVYTALATDPFTASAVAIDLLLAHPDPEGPHLVSLEEMDALQKSLAFQNANFLVDAIRLGEGKMFPIYRYWCQPVEGDKPSLCPRAEPPRDERDRQALMEYLPKIEECYRQMGLIKETQTIHWVGRQATLGTVCRCFAAVNPLPGSGVGVKPDFRPADGAPLPLHGESSETLPRANPSAPASAPVAVESLAAPQPATDIEPQPKKPVEVFFSYSHRDEKLRDQLEKHLSLLKHQGLIAGWHDRKIGGGIEWKGQIDQHLNSSRIILLLVSADFLASGYCYDVEMKRALERHEAGEARVIPIILKPCDWHEAPFAKLQAFPKDARPVTKWPNRDEAFTDVARGIRAAVAELASQG
jgi:hypothetical protein